MSHIQCCGDLRACLGWHSGHNRLIDTPRRRQRFLGLRANRFVSLARITKLPCVFREWRRLIGDRRQRRIQRYTLLAEFLEVVRLPKRYVVRAGERSYVMLTAKNGVDEYRMQADVTTAQKRGGDSQSRARQ